MAGILDTLSYLSLMLSVILWVNQWYLFLGLFVALGLLEVVWTQWQAGKAREMSPKKWAEWERVEKETSLLDKLLLYRGVKRIDLA